MSDSRRDSPLDDVDSFRILLDTYKDRQNGFVFATNPAALEYDGQVIGEGGMTLGRRRRGRRAAAGRLGRRLQPELGRRLARADRDDRGRLVGRVRDPVPHAALRAGRRPASGASTSSARSAGARSPPTGPRCPSSSTCCKVSQAGTLAGLDLPAQRNLKLIPYALGEVRERGVGGVAHERARRHRPRRQVRPHAQPDARRHRQHRLRAGGGGRAAGQPRSLQPVLPREAALLPRERRAVRGGRVRARPRCSSAGASASPTTAKRFRSSRGGAALGQGRAGERRAAQHADRRHGRLAAEQLHGGARAARLRQPLEPGRHLRGPRRHGRQGAAGRPQRVVRGGRALGHRPHRPRLGLRGALGHARRVGRSARLPDRRAQRDAAAHAQRRAHRDGTQLQSRGRVPQPRAAGSASSSRWRSRGCGRRACRSSRRSGRTRSTAATGTRRASSKPASCTSTRTGS